jgi:DNA-binding CsgD family transcriptional regulator
MNEKQEPNNLHQIIERIKEQHPSFEQSLRKRHKKISRTQSEICFLILGGYGIDEIAILRKKEVETIYTHRSNIGKLFGINTKLLDSYILNFEKSRIKDFQ